MVFSGNQFDFLIEAPDATTNWTYSTWTGSFADIRIYSRALSATEILQIHNSYGSPIKMLRGSFKVLQ
jgi:hypothetical protein